MPMVSRPRLVGAFLCIIDLLPAAGVDLVDLRSDALRGLRGGSGYNPIEGIQLSDHVREEIFTGTCRPLKDFRDRASSELAKEGFELAVADVKYPDHTFVLIRLVPGVKGEEDRVAIYINVDKVAPLSCRTSIGAFATRLHSATLRRVPAEDQQRMLARKVSSILSRLGVGAADVNSGR
jgi:hypothetical protein